MAELKRLALIAALSYSSGLGLAQSSEGSSASSSSAETSSVETSSVDSSSSSTSSSSRTKVIQTTNYIDTIEGYSSLSSCAIDVLSTVVRGEFSGCGGWDDNLTSYTCFCTDSYSFMSTVISTDIITSCDGGSMASAQATSALSVFDDYCALGVAAGLEPTSECRSSLRKMPLRAGRESVGAIPTNTPRYKQPAHRTPPPRRAQQAPRPHQHRWRPPRPPPTRPGRPPSPLVWWSPWS